MVSETAAKYLAAHVRKAPVTAATKSRRKPRKRTKPRVDKPLTGPPGSGKLSDALKVVVVQRLAMFDTPQQVVDFVKEEYGIELTRQGVQYYDPTVGVKPPKKWCATFESTRVKFLETQSDIPIAQRSFRLRRLEQMAQKAEDRGNYMLAAALYEQAAKEVGLLYTNSRHLGLSGEVKGGVLAVPVPVSAEEWGAAAVLQQAALSQKAKEAAANATKEHKK